MSLRVWLPLLNDTKTAIEQKTTELKVAITIETKVEIDKEPENEETNTPDKVELTEGEQLWLELYHKLSNETKAVLVNIAETFESLPADRQKFLLDAVRVVFDNQK